MTGLTEDIKCIEISFFTNLCPVYCTSFKSLLFYFLSTKPPNKDVVLSSDEVDSLDMDRLRDTLMDDRAAASGGPRDLHDMVKAYGGDSSDEAHPVMALVTRVMDNMASIWFK